MATLALAADCIAGNVFGIPALAGARNSLFYAYSVGSKDN
jgi:hypothetical protein